MVQGEGGEMINDRDTELIAISALRYAIGRRTYIVKITIDWIKRYWHHFSPKAQKVMIRDMEDSMLLNNLEDDWIDFKKWMENNNFSPLDKSKA